MFSKNFFRRPNATQSSGAYNSRSRAKKASLESKALPGWLGATAHPGNGALCLCDVGVHYGHCPVSRKSVPCVSPPPLLLPFYASTPCSSWRRWRLRLPPWRYRPTRLIWGISIGRHLDACSACWPWRARCGSWALSTGRPRRHRTVSQTWAPRAGPRAHDGRALVRGNQRHGPHHDAAAFGGHPYGREPPPSCGSRVRAAEPGCEPLRDDRPLRQPAEPVSLFLLRARPRRFPGRYGTALRAVDRRHRRLHLVAVRSVERQLWPRRYAQSRRADAAQPTAPGNLRSACRPHFAGRIPHRARSPPPSPS